MTGAALHGQKLVGQRVARMTMSQSLRDTLSHACRAFAATGRVLKLQNFDTTALRRTDPGSRAMANPGPGIAAAFVTGHPV